MRKSKEDIRIEAKFLFEEESEKANDFLERNINEIADALFALNPFEDEYEFIDRFTEEIEKYSEYLDCD